MNKSQLKTLLEQLYRVVAGLEQMFPGRPFTPDGHMVGSLGECLASYHYGLRLLTPSNGGHDARRNGKLVQIKATQGKKVALRSEPDHLLVLRLKKDGDFEEIYNGKGERAWRLASANKPKPSNGQYQIGIGTLVRVMKSVPPAERLPKIVD